MIKRPEQPIRTKEKRIEERKKLSYKIRNIFKKK